MVPSWLQAVILGFVQGVTEFVPVSSSGHLVLLPHLLGWERPGLAFDVALHLGTAAAIVVYFRAELFGMAAAFLPGRGTPQGRPYRRLAVLLVIGSVPVAIVGLAAKDWFERVFETPAVASLFLFVTAATLVLGERLRAQRVGRALRTRVGQRGNTDVGPRGKGREAPTLPAAEAGHDPEDPRGMSLQRVGVRQAVVIGLAQCLALFPGMSRSGTTITAGIAAGLTRTAATRFSFLLALPAMAGAALVSLPGLAEPGPYSGGEIVGGVIASAVAGYVAIAFLVRLVARAGLTVFVHYLLLAGAVGLAASLLLDAPT